MIFGDDGGGGELFVRFTRSLDVIGHELGHGVIEDEGPLDHQGQSGALNESLADVFGSLVKQFTLGQVAADADWLIGADLRGPQFHGRALRDTLAVDLGGHAWERAWAVWYAALRDPRLRANTTFAGFAAITRDVGAARFGAADGVAAAWDYDLRARGREARLHEGALTPEAEALVARLLG